VYLFFCPASLEKTSTCPEHLSEHLFNNNNTHTDQSLQITPMSYDHNKHRNNYNKAYFNDYIARRPGKVLVIEAEPCNGVCLGIQRGKSPSLYTVISTNAEAVRRARELGAEAHLGWTKYILPTLTDTYQTIYMDYCCTVTGNDNCRPAEEMPIVLKHLAFDGIVLFTFCKRGVEHSELEGEKLVRKAGFHLVETYRYMHTSPMFVLKCLNVKPSNLLKNEYERFATDYLEVDMENMKKNELDHAFLCDRCGDTFVNGTCFKNEIHTVCEECHGKPGTQPTDAGISEQRNKQFDEWFTNIQAARTMDMIKQLLANQCNPATQSQPVLTKQAEPVQTKSKADSDGEEDFTLPDGWKTITHRRMSGTMAGTKYTIYISPDGQRRCRSLMKVKQFLSKTTEEYETNLLSRKRPSPQPRRSRKRPRQSRRGGLGWNARSKMARKNKHNECWYKVEKPDLTLNMHKRQRKYF